MRIHATQFTWIHIRLGAMSKTHVSTPKSFNFVPKLTMDNKKLHLKVDNHPWKMLCSKVP